MEYDYLKTRRDLNTFRDRLKESGRFAIALDLEGEYNLHVYGEHLCLVQIFNGERLFLIDPFEAEIDLVKEILEDRFLLKIMYAASSDLALLERRYGVVGKGILDLKFAVELLEYPKQDLHSVLLQALGKTFARKKQFQTYNWMRRPLSGEAVDYALNDVLHLFELKDRLWEALFKADGLDRFILLNQTVQNKSYRIPRPEPWKKLKGYRNLKGKQRKVLQVFYQEREGLAEKLNQPPNNVISNAKLIHLAQNPNDLSPEAFGKRVNQTQRDRFIRSVLPSLSGLLTPFVVGLPLLHQLFQTSIV